MGRAVILAFEAPRPGEPRARWFIAARCDGMHGRLSLRGRWVADGLVQADHLVHRDPRDRRKGYGTACFTRMLDLLESCGYPAVRLIPGPMTPTTGPDREALEAWYARLGFRWADGWMLRDARAVSEK